MVCVCACVGFRWSSVVGRQSLADGRRSSVVGRRCRSSEPVSAVDVVVRCRRGWCRKTYYFCLRHRRVALSAVSSSSCGYDDEFVGGSGRVAFLAFEKKNELLLHIHRHLCRKTRQVLLNIFFGCCPLPSSHFFVFVCRCIPPGPAHSPLCFEASVYLLAVLVSPATAPFNA